jgi:hypothetical protein
MEEKEIWRRLDDMGLAEVRLRFPEQIAGPWYPVAIKWLAHKEDEERKRNEASTEAQMRIALRANKIAMIAAIAAIAAAIMAIVAIVISYLAWMYPRSPV